MSDDDDIQSTVRGLCRARGNRADALIEILHDVQEAVGHIPDSALPTIAAALNLSRAEVYGVVSFYHDFRTAPPAGPVVKLCRAEACQAMGCDALAAALERGVDGTSGAPEIRTVYCLGNCALSPAALVGDRLIGRADPAKIAHAVTPAWSPGQEEHSAAAPYTVYVPRDAAALSVGADEVAAAIAQEARAAGAEVRVVRTGSRGAFWLEPLIEVAVDGTRIGYGPVTPEDVPALFEAGFQKGGDHPKCIGPVEAHPFFAGQERLTFARCGIIDPLDLDDYRHHGGLAALRKAVEMEPQAVVDAVTGSGLRGRGGAGFPAGIKWQTTLDQPGTEKYICCNADEGDSGTFADRMLMEGDPLTLIEGMVIAGLAVGAETGYVYIRSEYPHAIRTMTEAVSVFEQNDLLGENILGSGRTFRIEIRRGAGSYICGEESAMLDSLEGKRGMVRAKPPIPAISGLFGKPTLVHNVLTLAAVPYILTHGAEAYRAFGMGRSRGTQPFQLAGNIKRGGLVEKAFGITLRELIESYGGGTFTGRPVRAVQVGGPLGAYLPAAQLDTEMDYETFDAAGAMIGHGGIVVFDDSVDMAKQAQFSMAFCAEESCGKCTPCRIGAVRGAELIQKIRNGENAASQVALLEDLCEVMTDGSLCAMGGLTPAPVLSALKYFPEDFERTAGGVSAPAAGGKP